MYIYINGEIRSKEQVTISPYDHGFLYGLGVFETFRVYNGHPFLLEDHYKRLRESLEELNVIWDYSVEDVQMIVQNLLVANGIKDAYIRFNVSAGIGDIGLQVEPYTQPTTIVFVKPLAPVGEVVEKEGVIVEVPRNTPEGNYRLKSHHYLNNIVGKREIGADMTKEGLFLTKEGYLAEGIVSNLFFVKEGTVYTPALATGILNGITRQFVMSLLHILHIPCEEGYYSLGDLEGADEVFVTNSIQEIVPLKKVGNTRYVGKEGVIVRLLLERYRESCEIVRSRDELVEDVSE